MAASNWHQVEVTGAVLSIYIGGVLNNSGSDDDEKVKAACGTPVIATALGGHPEIVINEYNGLLFRPGDAYDLAATVTWFEENGTIAAVMRQNALHTFRTQYTAELNYAQLLEIYSAALARRGRHLSTRTRHY